MNFPNDLSSVIAEIDSILPQSNSLVAGVFPVDRERQAQVLTRIRNYLLTLQRQFSSNPLTSNTPTPLEQETAQKIAQAVITQMQRQRGDWFGPIQTELESLRQQRQSLLKEIRQLEIQRQDIINDFLQVLLRKSSDSLNQQITQTLENVGAQLLYMQASLQQNASQAMPIGNHYPPVQPLQHLEHLQQLEQQSDRLLVALDATFRTVFETLERDLIAYQTSLRQGLERMHSLAEEGEATLTDYFQGWRNLEQSPLPVGEQQASSLEEQRVSEIIKGDLPIGTTPKLEIPSTEQFFPFAGVEILPQPVDYVADDFSVSEVPFPEATIVPVEPEIEQLLQIDLSAEEDLEPRSVEVSDAVELSTVENALFDSDLLTSTLSVAEPESEQLETSAMTVEQALEAIDLAANTNEEALFAGLPDPAQQHTPLLAKLPDHLEASSWEDGLFQDERLNPPETEPESAPLLVTATSVQPVSMSTPSEEDLTGVETIHLLTDLLEQGALNSEEYEVNEEGNEEEENLRELSDYQPTPTAEDLLPTVTSESGQQVDVEGLLAPSQLQQLSEDLERFEDANAQPSAMLPSESAEPSELPDAWEEQ